MSQLFVCLRGQEVNIAVVCSSMAPKNISSARRQLKRFDCTSEQLDNAAMCQSLFKTLVWTQKAESDRRSMLGEKPGHSTEREDGPEKEGQEMRTHSNPERNNTWRETHEV